MPGIFAGDTQFLLRLWFIFGVGRIIIEVPLPVKPIGSISALSNCSA